VLEHIPDDLAAMKEMFRVLRPGGRAIINVPLRGDSGPTLEDFSVTDPIERRRLFGQEDHVRLYGTDIRQRLQQAGFDVQASRYAQSLEQAAVKRYGLPADDIIYDCRHGAGRNS
jgi:ubiquinone/menaquinone biosynthesis C-methylase UbiE